MAARRRPPSEPVDAGQRSATEEPVVFTERLSAVIGDIYRTATDAQLLQHVLDELAWIVGADNAGLSIVNLGTGQAQFFLFSPVGMLSDAEVLGMFGALEPWRNAVLQREAGKLYIDEEIAMLHELTRSAEYRRWVRVTGNRSRCSGYLPLFDRSVAFLGFARGAGKGNFTRAEVRPVEALLPHLVQAVRMNRVVNELTVMHDVAEERYGTLGVGVVLLGGDHRVVYSSRAAQRILGLGLGLELEEGRLRCGAAKDQAQLRTHIEAQGQLAGRPGYLSGQSMTLSRPSRGAAPLSLTIAPYQNRLEVRTLISTGGRVLVLLFDPSFRAPTREQALQQIYGLSPAESELAAALAGGQRLDDVARERGLSKETLRSRLRRVFAKTGTRRQAELMRLLLASPALIEHRPAPK
jgi:DNA-binding CsgD family transcriptional regulator/PAS domain-containing protein